MFPVHGLSFDGIVLRDIVKGTKIHALAVPLNYLSDCKSVLNT